MRAQVKAELQRVFRPEFLNRLDETVIFRRLSPEDMLGITARLTDAVRERFAALGLYLELSEEALHLISEHGGSEAYGARSLRRSVQDMLLDPGAQMLLEGRIKPGDRLRAEVQDNSIIFSKI